MVDGQNVAVLHMAILLLFLALGIFVFIRLRLLFIAPLVLHDVLSGRRAVTKCFDVKEKKKLVSYAARQKLDGHPQDKPRPEEVQNLQHKQQPVEEEDTKERGVSGHRERQRHKNNPRQEGGAEQRL